MRNLHRALELSQSSFARADNPGSVRLSGLVDCVLNSAYPAESANLSRFETARVGVQGAKGIVLERTGCAIG